MMSIKLDKTDYYAYTANHAPADDRDTIVFVHGAAMDHSVWSHQSRYFAYHGYNVLAVDLPGHNLSGGALLGEINEMGTMAGAHYYKQRWPRLSPRRPQHGRTNRHGSGGQLCA